MPRADAKVSCCQHHVRGRLAEVIHHRLALPLSAGLLGRQRDQWVRVRYVRPPRMPLWADLRTGSVMDELAVARAQGGTAHRVTPEQWERFLIETSAFQALLLAWTT